MGSICSALAGEFHTPLHFVGEDYYSGNMDTESIHVEMHPFSREEYFFVLICEM